MALIDKHENAPVITIDGPSGSGKGTIARQLASVLGWHLLDSGALYRLVALAAMRSGTAGNDESQMAKIAKNMNVRFDSDPTMNEQIFFDGAEVSAAIRSEECGLTASTIAAMPSVRQALVQRQRAFLRPPGLIADGRDMGTNIFPAAALKVYLTASPGERAKRRYKQLKDKGIDVSLPALSRDIEDRDRRDSERVIAPLKPAADARLLDSSQLTVAEVSKQIVDWACELGIT